MRSARYQHTRVGLENGRRVAAAFEIQNMSEQPWRPSEGFAMAYHIFDPETGTLVVDGERLPPDTEISPGEARVFHLHFELPPEPGRYRVFVSPMQENVAWFYDRGWDFLLIDSVVEDGGARIERFGVSSMRSIRREKLLRSLGRAVTLPLLTLWRNRSLIRTMVRRDILGRYRGSFGGGFWAILNPLLLMLTYFFVFGVVLESRFPNDPSRAGFALYFLAGMLPWLAFSEAVGRAPGVLLEHRNFIKKLVFPVETLPVNLVAAGLVSEVFGVLLFLIGHAVARGFVPGTVVWLPVLLVPQILFTAGICWFLAALGILFRDLGQINGFLLTLWFFLTPICYPEASPGWLRIAPILAKNPLYVLVRGYRSIFLEGHAPAFHSLWKLWLLAAAVFVLGHAWFYKLRKSFADIV